MITLLAESKNMAVPKVSGAITGRPVECIGTQPRFLKEAAAIADVFASMPVVEIAERYEVSLPLAAKASKLFYEFHNPLLAETALKAFTGEVFMGLDVATLGEKEMEFAYKNVGIISSLYGYLQSSDVINPYRFDYYVENPMTCEKMQDYWKPRVTAALLRLLKDRDECEVLNLLPEAAAKCIDWSEIRKVAAVCKVSFKTVADNGKLKTPYSWKVKDLRGKLLREILLTKTDSIADVLQISIPLPLLTLDPTISSPLAPVFLTL